MRLGPLEIVLIIVVVIAVAVIARIVCTGRGIAKRNEATTSEATTSQPERNRLWGYLNGTGIVMIVAGIAALIAAVSLFRLVLQSYLWAFILMAAGTILVLFSRKRR